MIINLFCILPLPFFQDSRFNIELVQLCKVFLIWNCCMSISVSPWYLLCGLWGSIHNFHQTQSHQSLCLCMLCATTLKRTKDGRFSANHRKKSTHSYIQVLIPWFILKGMLDFSPFLRFNIKQPPITWWKKMRFIKRHISRGKHIHQWVRFLTYWFTVYTETSKQEQGAVWYHGECVPRSTHWRGGHRDSGKHFLHRRPKILGCTSPPGLHSRRSGNFFHQWQWPKCVQQHTGRAFLFFFKVSTF